MRSTSLSTDGKVVVVDRRKQKQEMESTPVLTVEEVDHEPDESTKSWKSIGYLIALIQGQNGILVSGRAVGLRGDGRPFVADYILPPIWPEKLDWIKEVRKRLDTFLGCQCKEHSSCADHKMYLGQWMSQDAQRIQMMSTQPVPEAIEVLANIEKKMAESRIVLPR